mgnify:CR=1 FL=1
MGKIDLLKEQAQDPRHDQSAFKSAFDGNYVPLMGSQPYVDENQDIDYKLNEDNIILPIQINGKRRGEIKISKSCTSILLKTKASSVAW